MAAVLVAINPAHRLAALVVGPEQARIRLIGMGAVVMLAVRRGIVLVAQVELAGFRIVRTWYAARMAEMDSLVRVEMVETPRTALVAAVAAVDITVAAVAAVRPCV